MATPEFETISTKPKFYGYIVGLHLQPNEDADVSTAPQMFATFEYSSGPKTYIVPDPDLFRMLAYHLCDNGQMRYEHGQFGYAKLWIEMTSEGWSVTLP